MSLPKNLKTKLATGSTLAATLALPLTAHFEGLKMRAYLDPVGIPTICYGETKDVALGEVKSREECDNMLTARLGYFAYQVDWQIDTELPPYTHAALASFMYNVGPGAFGSSTLRRKANAGDLVGACNELTRWVYAGGKKLPGLVRRREAEKNLCLQGLQLPMPA